mmetsp:Transcript_30992/g.100130  ORF Transcript_30992/g.100130 Transcript_30992/m.100130 type:complete len:363 (-) Transcript_30992:1698-2786(-)
MTSVGEMVRTRSTEDESAHTASDAALCGIRAVATSSCSRELVLSCTAVPTTDRSTLTLAPRQKPRSPSRAKISRTISLSVRGGCSILRACTDALAQPRVPRADSVAAALAGGVPFGVVPGWPASCSSVLSRSSGLHTIAATPPLVPPASSRSLHVVCLLPPVSRDSNGSYRPMRKPFLLASRTTAKPKPRCTPTMPSARHVLRMQSRAPLYVLDDDGASAASRASRVRATSAGLVTMQAMAGPAALAAKFTRTDTLASVAEPGLLRPDRPAMRGFRRRGYFGGDRVPSKPYIVLSHQPSCLQGLRACSAWPQCRPCNTLLGMPAPPSHHKACRYTVVSPRSTMRKAPNSATVQRPTAALRQE